MLCRTLGRGVLQGDLEQSHRLCYVRGPEGIIPDQGRHGAFGVSQLHGPPWQVGQIRAFAERCGSNWLRLRSPASGGYRHAEDPVIVSSINSYRREGRPDLR